MLLNVKKTKKIISIFAVAATFTIGCTATAFAVSAWKSNVALNKVIASASSPHHGSVIEANKITDYNDGAFVADPSGISFNAYRELTDDSVYEGFTTDPSGVSFSSHKGSLDIKSDPSDFDMKKAIADIEAGLIQPLSKDNLPKGISQDSILTFTEQDDTIVSITLD